MKYLKKWKLFESVYFVINLSHKGLTKLPVNYNNVNLKWTKAKFYCHNNRLTSLEGSPKEIGGNFYCRYNELTSLEGAPKWIGGDFDCRKNKLLSLSGAPTSVDGDFYCSNNQLTSLDHLPEVSGYIYIANNPVYWIVKNWIQEPGRRWEKWEYFQDLNIIQDDRVILERLEEFHEVMEIPMPDLEEIKKYYKIV